MSTRSPKKLRTAGKDSLIVPVLRNDAVEVGEMVRWDPDDDSRRTHCQQVAWLLREKLSDFVDKGGFPELGLRGVLDMAASRHIVDVDPNMLNPVLWRTLPAHVLHLIFARLPVPDIPRLGNLSREWRREMTTTNSYFTQECDKASPIMVAAFSSKFFWRDRFFDSQFLVSTCDLSKSTYKRSPHSFRLHWGDSSLDGPWNEMGAVDGGLVCFVSTWKLSKDKPLRIVVMNVLTRVRRKLPPLQYDYKAPPHMLHIEVDSKTKSYKVVVIGKCLQGHPTVEIYDSRLRRWTKTTTPEFGFISGDFHTWDYIIPCGTFKCSSRTRGFYDFAKRRLRFCAEGYSSVMTFWKNCKFVLHRNKLDGENSCAEGSQITMYKMHMNANNWVQERLYHLCSPLEDLLKVYPGTFWILQACEGFLMVIPDSSSRLKYFWLLDLSTEEWSKFPNCFEGHPGPWTSMSRFFWNVVP